jgi:cytochrome oxidase Cu insertion factor (SCO1/SenC/PrrC family)
LELDGAGGVVAQARGPSTATTSGPARVEKAVTLIIWLVIFLLLVIVVLLLFLATTLFGIVVVGRKQQFKRRRTVVAAGPAAPAKLISDRPTVFSAVAAAAATRGDPLYKNAVEGADCGARHLVSNRGISITPASLHQGRTNLLSFAFLLLLFLLSL